MAKAIFLQVSQITKITQKTFTYQNNFNSFEKYPWNGFQYLLIITSRVKKDIQENYVLIRKIHNQLQKGLRICFYE